MPVELPIKSEHTLIAGRDLITTERRVPRLPTPMEIVIAAVDDLDDWERFPRGFVHSVAFEGEAGIRFGIRVRTHNGSLAIVQDFACPFEATRADFGWRCGFMHALRGDEELTDYDAVEVDNGRRHEMRSGVHLRRRMMDGAYQPFAPILPADFDGSDFGRWPHGYYFPIPVEDPNVRHGFRVAQNIGRRLCFADKVVHANLVDCSMAILNKMAERVYIYGVRVMPWDLEIVTDLRLWEAVGLETKLQPIPPFASCDPTP